MRSDAMRSWQTEGERGQKGMGWDERQAGKQASERQTSSGIHLHICSFSLKRGLWGPPPTCPLPAADSGVSLGLGWLHDERCIGADGISIVCMMRMCIAM